MVWKESRPIGMKQPVGYLQSVVGSWIGDHGRQIQVKKFETKNIKIWKFDWKVRRHPVDPQRKELNKQTKKEQQKLVGDSHLPMIV